MSKIPYNCPSCRGHLKVVILECPKCGTRVEGNYELPRVVTLEEDVEKFLQTFLSSRGNIKEVEQRLNISYPTVRNRLNSLLRALGLEEPKSESSAGVNRSEILDRLERGEITAEEAARGLKGMVVKSAGNKQQNEKKGVGGDGSGEVKDTEASEGAEDNG